MLGIVRAIAATCTGLVAGIFLGYLVTAPARAALSASSFVEYEQLVHGYYVWMMPMLILAAMLASFSWLWLIRFRWRAAEFWLVAGSAVAMIFIAILTRTVNAPLNDQLMTWNVASPPANLRKLWAPWERAHLVRTVASVVAFVFAVVALTLKTSNKPA
jgi:uncharacterized membrane protein